MTTFPAPTFRPSSSLHASAVETLRGWRPPSEDQDSVRHAVLAFLAARPDACLRSCEPGHVTASMLLMDADREHVMLTLHPRVGSWLQLGGHCEPGDATLLAAALREGVEESGVDGIVIDPEPLHIGVHPITCSLGVPTRHLDVRFIATAPAGAQPTASAESLDLAWWPVRGLDADRVAPDVRTMAALASGRALGNGHIAR